MPAAGTRVGVGLLVVPGIGVAVPVEAVEMQDLGFEPPPSLRDCRASISRDKVLASTPSLGKNTWPLKKPSSDIGTNWSYILAVDVPGRASKRSATAWSAHCSALIENGSTPGAGTCSLTEANRPVSLSLRGKSATIVLDGFVRHELMDCALLVVVEEVQFLSWSTPKATMRCVPCAISLCADDLVAVKARAPESCRDPVAANVSAGQLLSRLPR